jgi:hypothetical protein
MAQNNIAFTITLNGIPTVISNVDELKAAIVSLKTELDGIDKSSDAYSALNGVVGSLEGRLKEVEAQAKQTGNTLEASVTAADSDVKNLNNDLDKTGQKVENVGKKTKEINFEKAFQSFAKVGSAVTSSFAAAQAAIGLFGGDTTKVAEAAAKAQNALTLAIAAREVAEGVGAITTVRATIAQKAKNLADTASIGILKKLFAVIAANPLTALAVAIGLVVTAIYTLVDAEGEAEKQAKSAAEAQDAFNKAVQDAGTQAVITSAKLESLISLFGQGAIDANELRAGLQDIIPTLKDFSILGEDATKAFQDFTNAQIELAKSNGELKAAEEQFRAARDAGNLQEQNRILFVIKGIQKTRAEQLSLIEGINNLIEDRKKTQAAADEAEKKAAEERQRRLLEQIKLTSELVIKTNQQFEAQQKLGELNVQFATEKQLDLLKSLAKASEDYATVTQKLTKLTADLSDADLQRIKDAEAEITAAGQRIENLNTLLVKGFEKAGVALKTSDFKKLIQDQFAIESGQINDLDAQLKNFTDRQKFLDAFIDQYTAKRLKASKNTGEALKAEEEAYRAEATALFETLAQNERGLVEFQAKVTKLKDELIKLTAETNALKNSQDVLNGFIRENAVDITKQYTIKLGDLESNRKAVIDLQTQLDTKLYDKSRTFQSQVTTLEEQLLAQGFDIRKASYEEKLALLKLFLEKEVKATEDANAKQETAEKKRIDKFLENIQNFQAILNTLQQTSTLFFNAQFDQLEKRYKRVQDTIVGDSEAANKKRLEAEKAYQNERIRLEKQAAKTALRISLAQALANTAEAITKVTAQTGVGAIVAGTLIAALNAVQVGIIGNQLANIDNYRKGGRIRNKMAGGGLVTGPSHEYGGVKFQGGGIELEGNEAVINRQSTINYMGLLDQINQAGGGRPIGPGFDDSRIVEAIAKQRNTPIRAYVVESDITAKQETARRLEKLSQI